MRSRKASSINKILLAAAIAMLGSSTAYAAQEARPAAGDAGGTADRTWQISAGKNRDLFSSMQNLMPGDVIDNTVVITNRSSGTVSFYLRVQPGDSLTEPSGPDDAAAITGKTYNAELLDQITMDIWSGGNLVYHGAASGKGEHTESGTPVLLGGVDSGRELKLRVGITLPGAAMTNEFASSFSRIEWQFIAEGVDSGTNGGGNTGESGVPDSGETSGSGPDIPPSEIPDGEVPLEGGRTPGTGEAAGGTGLTDTACRGGGVVVDNVDGDHTSWLDQTSGDPDELQIVVEDALVPLSAFSHGSFLEQGIILYPLYILLLLSVLLLLAARTAKKWAQKNTKKN